VWNALISTNHGGNLVNPRGKSRDPNKNGLYFRGPYRLTWCEQGEEVRIYWDRVTDGVRELVGVFGYDEWEENTFSEIEEIVMSYLRKIIDSKQSGQQGEVLVLTDWATSFPALREWMTATKDPDGRPRDTATLLLTVDHDGLKGRLLDRQSNHQIWVTGTTVGEVFAALEAALVSPQPNWRKTNWTPPQKGKRA